MQTISENNDEFFAKIEVALEEESQVAINSTIYRAPAVITKLPLVKAKKTKTKIKNEINVDEPVKLSSIEFDEIEKIELVALFDEIKTEQELVTDTTETKMAASEKIKMENLEEPIFLEIEKDKKSEKLTQENKTAEPEFHVVNNEIEKEKMKDEKYKTPAFNVNTQIPSVTRDDMPIKVPNIDDMAKISSKHKVARADEYSPMKKSDEYSPKEKYSDMSIQFLNTATSDKISNFEVRLKNSRMQGLTDYGKGVVNVARKINGNSVLPIQIAHNGFVTVNADLEELDGESFVEIPGITEEKIEKITQNVFSEESGYLLIEIDEDTENIFIDKKALSKIYLDSRFNVVKENYSYVLFSGFHPGNLSVKFIRFDGSESSKLIYTQPGEISFDINFYENNQNVVELFEESLMAKEENQLSIEADKVKQIFNDNKTQKISVNKYKLASNKRTIGSRNYAELKHFQESVYIGFVDKTKVIVPSEEKISETLKKFNQYSLENSCLIQVNLSKKIKEYDILPESVDENLMSYSLVQDMDGKFYETVSEKTEKIIILGENQGNGTADKNGKINLNVTYTDGSTQSMTTFCSPQAYLVEQL
jgi:hypothetical protein